MNLEKYLLLSIKELSIIVILFIGAAFIHNLIYKIFPVMVIIIVYFIIAVIYTIFHHVKRIRKKKR